MKFTRFLNRNYYGKKTQELTWAEVGAFVLAVLSGIIVYYWSNSYIIAAVAAVLVKTYFKLESESGLLIDGEEIVFKRFKEKRIDPKSIAAIKICKTYHWVGGKYDRRIEPFLKENGDQAYSMFLLSETREIMANREWDNDISFFDYFKVFIICETVYDREVVNHLKTRNPEIKIIW